MIAAIAALFWKWTVPMHLWSNQKPSQRTEVEGVIDWLDGGEGSRRPLSAGFLLYDLGFLRGEGDAYGCSLGD